MKTRLVLGAMCAMTAMVATSESQAQMSGGSAVPAANEVIKAPTLSTAAPTVTKTSTTAKVWVTEFVIDKSAKISTGKFTLGAMDADESASPISKIKQTDCEKLLIKFDVYKKNGSAWDKVFSNIIHGYWYHSAAAGTIDRCKLKDGSGSAPQVATKPLLVPTGATVDTYRVVASSGYTAAAWPANAAAAITTFRKVDINLAMTN